MKITTLLGAKASSLPPRQSVSTELSEAIDPLDILGDSLALQERQPLRLVELANEWHSTSLGNWRAPIMSSYVENEAMLNAVNVARQQWKRADPTLTDDNFEQGYPLICIETGQASCAFLSVVKSHKGQYLYLNDDGTPFETATDALAATFWMVLPDDQLKTQVILTPESLIELMELVVLDRSPVPPWLDPELLAAIKSYEVLRSDKAEVPQVIVEEFSLAPSSLIGIARTAQAEYQAAIGLDPAGRPCIKIVGRSPAKPLA